MGCSCCQCHNEHHHHHHMADNKKKLKKRLIRLCIAAGLFAFVFAADKIFDLASVNTGLPGWILPFVCFFAVYLIEGTAILKDAGKGLINGYLLDENFLMAVASLGAFALGIYKGCIGQEPDGFEEGCSVILFYCVGEFFQDLALARSEHEIIRMMDKHQIDADFTDRKTRTETFIAKFARVYTPIVVGLAIVIALIPPGIGILTGKGMDLSLVNESQSIFTGPLDLTWTTWIYRALSFLVVSCPCALVISIPMAFCMGVSSAGKRGIFLKGTNCIEQVYHAKDLPIVPSESDPEISVIRLETEDGEENLILLENSRTGPASIRRIAKRTMRIVLENIICTIGVKIIVLVLSAFGITNMWVAIFADVGMAVLAVLNSMRVGLYHDKKE